MITFKEHEKELLEAMSPQQKMDFDRMMAGAMNRDDYNKKWKKPLKSDAKVIYGKNFKSMKESEELDESVIRIQHTDSNGNTHVLSSSNQGFVALNKGNSSLANVMHSAPGHASTGTKEKSEALNKAIKSAHAGGKDSVLAAAKKATGLNWTHHSVTEAYTPEPGHKIITKKGGQVPGTVEKLEKDYVYFRHPEGKMFRTHKDNVQKDSSVKESEDLEESSEWETRHDEFVSAGKAANSSHINKVLSDLKDTSSKASSKRGFINQIVGKKSNGDLSREAIGADVLHKNITRNKNAAHGTDARKELGQHLVYAKSLLKRMNESEDLEEALTYKQKLTHIRVDPINSTPKHLLGKVGVFGEKDDLSKDEHYKKAMADAHEYGKTKFDGKYEVTHVGHKQDKIRAGSVAKVRKSMEEAVLKPSDQAKTTLKHIKNPSLQDKYAAYDIKPGVKGYRDRIDLLRDAKAKGKLKEESDLEEVKAAEDMAGTSATSTKQKSSDLGKSGKKAPGNKNINLAEALSSEEGPAKGAEFKEMTQEQHLECMKHHKDEYNAIKGKTHKYIKELDETGKTESKLKYHAKMYHKHKEAA